jgi:hypothetical protein
VPYTFRHRLILPDVKLTAEAHEIVLAETNGKERVALEAGERNAPISGSSQLVLTGSGYASEDDAHASAVKWRQYVTDGLASQAISADFGEDDPSTRAGEWVQASEPPEYLANLGYAKGDRIIADDTRLLIFESDPPPKFSYGEVYAPTISLGVQGLLDRLNELKGRPYRAWSSREQLSYKLMHSSLSDKNPDTRFIQLVTAVETLLPGALRPEAELDAIATLASKLEATPNIEPEVKQSVKDLLDNGRRKSISREAGDLLAVLSGTYNDKSAKSFFGECYRIRSKLVHGEPRGLSAKEYGKHYNALLNLVRDLLDTVLRK